MVALGRFGPWLSLLGAGIGVACADRDPVSSIEVSTGGHAGNGGAEQPGGKGGTQNAGGASAGGKGSAATGGTSVTSEAGGSGHGGKGGNGGGGGTRPDDPGGAGGDAGDGGEAGGDEEPACSAAEWVNTSGSAGGEGGAGGQGAGPVPTWAYTQASFRMKVAPIGRGDFIVLNAEEFCGGRALERIRPDGTMVWSRHLPGSGWVVRDIVSTPSGETFIAGEVQGAARIGGETFEYGPSELGSVVVKLDADGDFDWVEGSFSLGHWHEIRALAPDTRGGVVVAGFFNAAPVGGTEWQAFVGALDATGDVKWTRSYGIQSTGYDVVVDALGEVLVQGWADVGTDLGAGALAAATHFFLKLDANGGYRWHKGVSLGASIARGPGNDHLALLFHGDTAPSPWTLGRYRPDGSVVFERPASGGDLLGTGGGHIVTVSGGIMTTVGFHDLDGEHVGSYEYGPGGAHQAHDLAVTPGDDVMIAGTFEEHIDFGFVRAVEGEVEDSHGYFLALRGP
jgi:hypothetical protein